LHMRGRVVAGMVLACLGAGQGWAQEWSASAYGTLGYAVSDRPYTYLRFINDQGTVKRDSIFGAQLDLRLNPQWSATVQAKLAPSPGDDNKWGLNTAWVFLSWRPDNDWHLRAGKQRLPLYLHSESVDVGQTYDLARLPQNFYGLMPSNEFTGLYASRNWALAAGDLSLDSYGGEANMTVRAYSRDDGVGFISDVARYVGAALTLRQAHATWRFSAHSMRLMKSDGTDMSVNFPYYAPPGYGGLGYYRVSPALPGPDIGMASHKSIRIFTLGADVELAPGWHLVSELARSSTPGHIDAAWSTVSGYAAVLHSMGRFTPYVSISRLKSLGVMARRSAELDAIYWPGGSPTAEAINATQRAGADYWGAFDEHSLAVGTSLAITPQSKLKFEWMRTEVGKRSAMVDSPASGVVRHQHINVLTANYSFVF